MRIKLFFSAALIFFSVNAFAELNTYVSILPQKFFLEQIAGDRIKVNVMVMPGASPATYEPKPKQMAALSSTDIYFAIGAPFEAVWIPKFRALNKNMKIVNTDAGIEKLTMEKHVHHDDEGEEHHDDDHGGIKDPHIWLDPILVMKQAENTAAALCEADPAGCDAYKNGKERFIEKLKGLDKTISGILSGHEGEHFMVFHPSWGYFSERYRLHQVAVELEGKEPKPSDLRGFIELAREHHLKAIFIQPQFAKKAAELIARETGANVVAIDPLSENWEENLIYVAKTIADSR